MRELQLSNRQSHRGAAKGPRHCRILPHRRQRQLERLENRHLLAGDVVAGDANRDFYFDEADWVQVFQAAKFETSQATTWEQGDWNGDGEFSSSDIVESFVNGTYLNGPYDPEAADEPTHARNQFVSTGETNVTAYYLPADGSLVIATSGEWLTTVHVSSEQASFKVDEPSFDGSIFDVASETSRFSLLPDDSFVVYRSALAPNLSAESLLGDLSIAGSLLSGGGLGSVRLDVTGNLPDELAQELEQNEPPQPGGFVSVEQATAVMAYDAATGDVVIHAVNDTMTTIEIVSSTGSFAFTADIEYAPGLFDVAQPTKFFRLNADGINQLRLPGLLQSGLSLTDIEVDLTIFGSMHQSGPLSLALVGSVDELPAPFEPIETPVDPTPPPGRFVSIEDANATMSYDPATGDMLFEGIDGQAITVLEVVSAGETLIYSDDDFSYTQSLFDVAVASKFFRLEPNGFTSLLVPGLLPAGLTNAEVAADLTVEGAILAGGPLHVHFVGAQIIDPPAPIDPPPWVNPENATATMAYDPANGDVRIEALPDAAITTIEINSARELFSYSGAIDYAPGIFDVAIPRKFFRLDPNGIAVLDLPGLLRPGLTVEELQQDLSINGSMLTGGRLRLALGNVAPSPVDPPSPTDAFVDRESANVVMSVDSSTGDVVFQADVGLAMGSVHVLSSSGALAYSSDFNYAPGIFDRATPEKFFRLDPGGFASLEVPGLVAAESSIASLTNDLEVSGSLVNGEPIRFHLEVTRSNPVDPVQDWHFAPVESANALMGYESETGNVYIELLDDRPLAVIELISQTDLTFAYSYQAEYTVGLFDIASPNKFFRIDVDGFGYLDLPGLLPAGLSIEEIGTSITSDGAFLGGGGLDLGLVPLNELPVFSEGETPPEPTPEDEPAPMMAPVSPSEADALFSYDDETGNVVVSSVNDTRLTSLALRSNEGNFAFSSLQQLSLGQFDVAETGKFLKLIPTGTTRVELPGLMKPGLSIDTLRADLTVAATSERGPLMISEAVTPMSAESIGICRTERANGAVLGDANLDGEFDSTDLIEIMAQGGYLDGASSNGHWAGGDWNCDGEFDSGDLVDAMKQGSYRGVDLAAALECEAMLDRGFAQGDANLDGVFDSADLIAVLATGQYRDAVEGNSNWQTGDWNCDGEFDSSDLVAALANTGYSAGEDGEDELDDEDPLDD